MRTALLLVGVAALATSSAASAATVFSDGFETDATALSVTALNNFSVRGTVDVVGPANGFGIVAPSNVVDLDGTPGPGRITSLQSFAFGANNNVSLSFVLGGAQRGSNTDVFQAGFTFAGVTQLNNITLGGAYGNFTIGNSSTPSYTVNSTIRGGSPFQTYSISFRSGNASSLNFFLGTNSADNVGPLLDSVRLNVTAVPEPASWALMIGGFAMVGFAARRRRSGVIAA